MKLLHLILQACYRLRDSRDNEIKETQAKMKRLLSHYPRAWNRLNAINAQIHFYFILHLHVSMVTKQFL